MLNTYLIDLGLMVNREKGNRDIRKESDQFYMGRGIVKSLEKR